MKVSPTKPNIGTNFIKKFIEFRTDPFNAYASVIDSISNIRFVLYDWNFQTRQCENPSKFKACLFYLQVLMQFIYIFQASVAFGLYFHKEEINVGHLVPDMLLMVGFVYGVGYQISSLVYGRETELHVNQQVKLDKRFCEMLGVESPDGWNRGGILYFFSLMCSGTRPFVPYMVLPFFLKTDQPMSLYYRLGGQRGEVGWYFYGIWCAFTLGCTYSITNYYAILSLGHNYFTIFWLKFMKTKMGKDTSPETAEVTHMVYRMLQLHNRLYFCSYSRIILPVVIFCASAWVVFAICTLLKVFDQISILTLLMVSTAASQACLFLNIQFYSSHRMTCLSEEFLEDRRALNTNSLLRKCQKSYPVLKIRVGSSYHISVDNMLTWSEAIVNYTILLLSAF